VLPEQLPISRIGVRNDLLNIEDVVSTERIFCAGTSDRINCKDERANGAPSVLRYTGFPQRWGDAVSELSLQVSLSQLRHSQS